jgi:hypothetical protein
VAIKRAVHEYIPAVSTFAPAFNNVSTISALPFRHAQTRAEVPY